MQNIVLLSHNNRCLYICLYIFQLLMAIKISQPHEKKRHKKSCLRYSQKSVQK